MDFVDLGAHCSLPNCHQQDFLPFACDGCSKKFCVKHRYYLDHSCRNIPSGPQVITCPICGKGINIRPGQDFNYLWELHYNSQQCSKQHRVTCASKSCKKVINDINSITCSKCSSIVCLAHRFSDQHPCKDKKSESFCITF